MLRLSGISPHIRVRIGDGVRVAVPEGGLRDVQVSGDAGLAPGTQNGIPPNRNYVFRATGTGEATITGLADAARVSGRVTSHC